MRTCPICASRFLPRDILQHMRTHPQELYRCKYCSFETRESLELLTHDGRCRRLLLDGFTCPCCSEPFSHMAALRAHRGAQKTSFPCHVGACVFSAASFEELARHAEHKHRRRSCELCCRSYVQKHACSARKKKEHQCPECDFRTRSGAALARHRAAGHRAAICSECGYRGKSQHALSCHRRSVHYKEHRCPECSVKCESASVLARHRKSHVAGSLRCSRCRVFWALDQRTMDRHLGQCSSSRTLRHSSPRSTDRTAQRF